MALAPLLRHPGRQFSDSDVARVIQVTTAAVVKLRRRGLLPRRAQVGTQGSTGVLRWRFVDIVAAECARVAGMEFNWDNPTQRRVAELVRSGDEDLVRAHTIAWLPDELPGTRRAVFVTPADKREGTKFYA